MEPGISGFRGGRQSRLAENWKDRLGEDRRTCHDQTTRDYQFVLVASLGLGCVAGDTTNG